MLPLSWLIDHLHVGTPDSAVVRLVARRARRADIDKATRKSWYRFALERHRSNRALLATFG